MHQALILARRDMTPVSYWMSLSIVELLEWIRVHNRLEEKLKKK